MATWEQLPAEIRDIFLYLFTLQVADEYTQLGIDFWSDCNLEDITDEFECFSLLVCFQHFP